MTFPRIGFAVLAFWLCVPAAHAKTICTAIADGKTGDVLLQEGNCAGRVTPASTFKIVLSLIGYDSGFLKSPHNPALPFREGYPDWGGETWKQPTDPAAWMKHSVVWFSQQITRELGMQRFADYVAKLDYGNMDVSGDPGKANGVERAWIASSLKISPLEQVAFVTRFLNRQLPLSAEAFAMTGRIVQTTALPGGWQVHGKTGSAFPRNADMSAGRRRATGPSSSPG